MAKKTASASINPAGKIILSKPNFNTIPQFTRSSSYAVDVGWGYLISHYEEHVSEYGLNINPDFQRGHVWTEDKQIAFVEFCLRGGRSAKELQFNCVNWQSSGELGEYVLVDGLQRLTAAMRFMRNEIPAFGYKYKQFSGNLRIHSPSFRWNVNDLDTRAEVLTWYLELNSGGVVHTDAELERVRKLLEAEG